MVNLNFKSFGQGKPIVFLHGLFGMLDNWQSFGKRIAESGYMVFLIDQRAHGRSNSGKGFDYPLLSEDLRQFLDDNWIHELIIVGHSMGGKTAMQFASDYPDYVEKLVVVDIAPKIYEGNHLPIFDALQSIDLEQVKSRSEVLSHLQNKLPNQPESTIQFLLKNLKRRKVGGYEWKMDVHLLRTNYEHILDNVTLNEEELVETLFINGSNSNYIIEEDRLNIKSIYSNVEFQTIEAAGHWVHADKPDELFTSIISFIER